MAVGLEDIRVLQGAENLGDGVWRTVNAWNDFARDTVGKQLTRATDSIGANIAESYGRYSFGEKTQYLYYARGSLFETKYWLNRALRRGLLSQIQHQQYCDLLVTVGRQINAFMNSIKSQRREMNADTHATLHEPRAQYESTNGTDNIITETDFAYLGTPTDAVDQSPISNP